MEWLPDELAGAGAEHLDATYISTYDQKAGFDPSEDVELLRGLGLGAASTIVDLGAGTGTFALAAALHCRRVIAVDVSPAMVDWLRRRIESMSTQNVEVALAGLLSYRHVGEPPDFVYTRNALHHLPDFWKAVALSHVAAMLRPGGVLRVRDLIYSFDLPEVEDRIERWLENASPDTATGWTRSELAAHVRDEHSTFAWLFEEMLDRAGFNVEDVKHSATQTYSAYVCRRV
jgi:SAM-dependent methyltransferase